MKSTFLSITLGLTLFTFTNCKDAQPNINIDYKYADQPEMVVCKLEQHKLIKEALYSFENDIREAYNKTNRQPQRTFQGFVTRLINKSFSAKDVASRHSFDIAKALQQSKYYKNNMLDLNGELGACIFDNIKDQNLKTSLNALKKANSLRPNVVLPTFRNYSNNFVTDKNLTALLAFDYYYNQVMLLNESDLKVPSKAEQNKIDFNKVPSKQLQPIQPTQQTPVKTGHEGHNH